ncbi:MAG: carboxypeptidase-like regulatory domain-containing protein, partial [Candidatus Micrarchaeota archaeon]
MADEWQEGPNGPIGQLREKIGELTDFASNILQGTKDNISNLYSQGQEKYYAFADYLEDEKNIPIKRYFIEPFENAGIPTFPVLLFLVFLLFLILLFILWPRAPPSLELTVISENGDWVPDASVSLVFATNALDATTNSKGIAKFTNLRKGTAELQVSHPDYEQYNDTVTIKGKDKLKIELSPLPSDTINFEIFVKGKDGNPINGANLQLFVSGSDTAQNYQTDSSGKRLVKMPKGAEVTIAVSKEGYQDATLTTNSDAKKASISLLKVGEAPNGDKPIVEEEGYPPADLKIYTIDENNKPIRAYANIYDSRVSGTPLKSIATNDLGLAQVSDFTQGTPVTIVATFSGHQEARKSLTLKAKNEVTLVLKGVRNTQNATKKTDISVFDFKSKAPISQAKVTIFNSLNEMVVVGVTDAKGLSTFVLPTGSYNAFAEAPEYDFEKAILKAGDRKSIYLKLGGFVKLIVDSEDEDGKAYSRTAISFFDQTNGPVPPFTIYSSSNGKAKAEIKPGNYLIKAVKDALFGKKEILVLNQTNNTASVKMYHPRGYLKVEARDLKTRVPIPSFNVIVTDKATDEQAYSKACGAANCIFWLRAFKSYEIAGTATDFESSKATFITRIVDWNSSKMGENASDGTILPISFESNMSLYLKSTLIPPEEDGSFSMAFDAIYDESDSVQVSSLRRGRAYIAHFAADYDDILRKKGLYVKIGSELTSSSWESGFIESLLLSGGESPSRASGNAKLEASCNLLPESGLGSVHLRHALPEYSFDGTGTIKVMFSVSESIPVNYLNFLWQGRAVTKSNLPISQPAGIAAFNECTQTMQQEQLQIDNCGILNSPCCDDGCLTGLYCDETGGNICRNIGTKPPNLFECPSLEIQLTGYGTPHPSCERVTFKVDSIFPADAIPLSALDTSGTPTSYYNLKFTSKTNPSLDVSQCFSWSQSVNYGGTALRYWPKGTCPYKPNGNSVPAAVFYMNITDIITTRTRSIEINVENETTMPFGIPFAAIEAGYTPYKELFPASNMVPKSYYGTNSELIPPANGRTMLPIYFLNNRQLQADNDDLFAGAFVSGTFRSTMPTEILSDNENKGGGKLIAWDVNYWNQFIANSPIQLHTTIAKPSSVMTVSPTNQRGTLLSLVDAPANAAPSQRVAAFKNAVSDASKKSLFRRAYPNAISPPSKPSDIEALSPYKYFVSSIETTPPKFSLIYSEWANHVINSYSSQLGARFLNFENGNDMTQDHCRVREGIYKLTVQSLDGANWGYTGGAFGMEALKISHTTNNLICPQIYACNLIDGRQITNSPNFVNSPIITKPKDCFYFEYPIVPDGASANPAIDLTVNYRDITSKPSEELTPGTFYLSQDQSNALSDASITYMASDGETWGEVAPYVMSASYPVVFTNDELGGACGEQIVAGCICGGATQDSSGGYCCNGAVSDIACTANACADGESATPADPCTCGGTIISSGYCCDTGIGVLSPSQSTCTLICTDKAQITLPCLCGLNLEQSGYCCGLIKYAAGCPPSSVTLALINIIPDKTYVRAIWTTDVPTDFNQLIVTGPQSTTAVSYAFQTSHDLTTNPQLTENTLYNYELNSCAGTACNSIFGTFRTASSTSSPSPSPSPSVSPSPSPSPSVS